MIGDISVKTNLYLVSGYTDMRRSIDGLCATIQNMLHTEPDSMSVYLFCGKRCDRIKNSYQRTGRHVPAVQTSGLQHTGSFPVATQSG